MIIGSSNSTFSLQEVFVTDFDDNYHRFDTDPSNELERAVSKIRRRYSNIADYMEAVAIYNEYMGLLAVKHGNPDILKLKLKHGAVKDFLPPKPRMKNTTENRDLLKNKIIVSRTNVRKVDDEKLDASLSTFNVNNEYDGMYIQESEVSDPVGKSMIKEGLADNQKMTMKQLAKVSDIDYLEEYFAMERERAQEQQKKKFNRLGLSQIIRGEMPEDPDIEPDETGVILYNGSFMTPAERDQVTIYQHLGKVGWDSLKLMKTRGEDKGITKLMKDDDKKKKKKNKKRNDDDDFIVKMVTDGNFDSFGEFQDEMLKFDSTLFKG